MFLYIPKLWLTSSSYFSELTDAIKEDWGGKPFVDLGNGWTYILENYPQVWALASQPLLRF
jgi:nitrogen fixation protein